MAWFVEKGHSISVDESYDDLQKSGYIMTYSEQNVSWHNYLEALLPFLIITFGDLPLSPENY